MDAQGKLDRASEEERRPILIVEDEVLVPMVLADVPRVAVYHVVEVASAHEARLRLGDQVKLVITANIDGVELAWLVRSKCPGVKIILTSAYWPTPDWAEYDGFLCGIAMPCREA
jgi:CheY-like chemotaxis protein